MKKLLLLSLAISIGYCASAQKIVKAPSNLLNKKVKKELLPIQGNELQQLPLILNDANPYVSSKSPKDLGTVIGTSYYDLQSNSNTDNRILVYPDGKITAVWTMSQDGAGGFGDRGTGYNHSSDGGNTWLDEPTARIETVKTGWPNIGNIDNDNEIVVAHNGGGLTISKHSLTNNPTTWTPNSFVTNEITWPHMYVNGNTIHVIGTSDTGTPIQGFTAGTLVYTRSTDGGQNWSTPIIPIGLDTANYPTHIGVNSTFGDEESLAGNGNTVVIMVGAMLATPAIIKSTDNGVNWTYKEILHLPLKKYLYDGGIPYDINGDNVGDLLYGSDNTNFVTVDNNGVAHCFFGSTNEAYDGTSGTYYPYDCDGIYYWNDTMPTMQYTYRDEMHGTSSYYTARIDTVNFPIITSIVDLNGNDTIDFPDNSAGVNSNQLPYGLYRSTSLSSQPNAVVDNNGNITLFYSSIVEGTDILTGGTDHLAVRNIWMMKKYANSLNWTNPVRIAPYSFKEEVYPCVAPKLTTNGDEIIAHLIYQGDDFPGTYLQTDPPHPIDINSFYYKSVILNVGIKENDVVKTAPVVYPNPASNYVTVNYSLTNTANVTLSIYNTVGQQIMTTTKNVNAGDAKVTLNIESLTHGVYFVKSDINGKTYTNKLVVK